MTIESLHRIDEVTLTRDSSAVYALEGDGVDWHTGFNETGDQLLVILRSPNDLIVVFSSDGLLKGVTLLPGLPIQTSGSVLGQDDHVLRHWFNLVGFRPGLITVRKFFLPEYHVGIADLPLYYQEILLNPTRYLLDEQAFAHRELVRWSAEGMFEFSLGDHVDFWIDKTGQIVAT